MAIDERERQRQVAQGAALYSPLTLALYDQWVYGVAVRLMGCSPDLFLDLYERNVSFNHLDMGVGSGMLLKHCLRRQLLQRVTLFDLNPDCLAATEKALRPLPVRKVRADMLKPFPLVGERFLSVGLNFLLHCVPGSFREKGVVFRHVRDVLAPGGRVFGSTCVYQPGWRNAPARILFDRYNQIGAFHNREDVIDDLQFVLRDLFENVELMRQGSVVFFRASDGPL